MLPWTVVSKVQRHCRQAGMCGLPITVTVTGRCSLDLSCVGLLTRAAGEATDLKLKNLNLYLHSVQPVALNQILQILNLHLHTTSYCTLLSLTLTQELVSLRFSRSDRPCSRLLCSAHPSGRLTPPSSRKRDCGCKLPR